MREGEGGRDDIEREKLFMLLLDRQHRPHPLASTLSRSNYDLNKTEITLLLTSRRE